MKLLLPFLQQKAFSCALAHLLKPPDSARGISEAEDSLDQIYVETNCLCEIKGCIKSRSTLVGFGVCVFFSSVVTDAGKWRFVPTSSCSCEKRSVPTYRTSFIQMHFIEIELPSFQSERCADLVCFRLHK